MYFHDPHAVHNSLQFEPLLRPASFTNIGPRPCHLLHGTDPLTTTLHVKNPGNVMCDIEETQELMNALRQAPFAPHLRHLTTDIPIAPSGVTSLVKGLPHLRELTMLIVQTAAARERMAIWSLPYLPDTEIRKLVLMGPKGWSEQLQHGPHIDLATLVANDSSSSSSRDTASGSAAKRRRLADTSSASSADSCASYASSGTGASSHGAATPDAAAASTADSRRAAPLSCLTLCNLRLLRPEALGALLNLQSLNLSDVFSSAEEGFSPSDPMWPTTLRAVASLTRLKSLTMPMATCSREQWNSCLAHLPLELLHLHTVHLGPSTQQHQDGPAAQQQQQQQQQQRPMPLRHLQLHKLCIEGVPEQQLPGYLGRTFPLLQHAHVSTPSPAATFHAALAGHPLLQRLHYHTSDGGAFEVAAAQYKWRESCRQVERATAEEAALAGTVQAAIQALRAGGAAAAGLTLAEGKQLVTRLHRARHERAFALADQEAALAEMQQVQEDMDSGKLNPKPPLCSYPALTSVRIDGVVDDRFLLELSQCRGLQEVHIYVCAMHRPAEHGLPMLKSPKPTAAGLAALASAPLAACLRRLRVQSINLTWGKEAVLPLLRAVSSGAMPCLEYLEVPARWGARATDLGGVLPGGQGGGHVAGAAQQHEEAQQQEQEQEQEEQAAQQQQQEEQVQQAGQQAQQQAAQAAQQVYQQAQVLLNEYLAQQQDEVQAHMPSSSEVLAWLHSHDLPAQLSSERWDKGVVLTLGQCTVKLNTLV